MHLLNRAAPGALPLILTQGGLDTPSQALGLPEVQRIARERYGLVGEFRRFATEKDETFRVRDGDGRMAILKISNPAESTLEIDFQLDLLRHIERAAPDVPTPRVIQDLEGRSRSAYVDENGSERVVRLLSYIDGVPLDSTESSPVERERVGEVLAKLRHATAAFSHAGDQRELAWDVRHLPQLTPLLDEIADVDHRRSLEAAIERFSATTTRLPELRAQVLHNDFSKSNIVVDHDDPGFVRGIIDFGDAVHTAVAIDVSTALLNQLPPTHAEDAFARGRDLLRGYLRYADLTQEELSMIPHLTMGRVALRALLTTWRARLFPENAEYIVRNTAQGWWQLQWFLSRDSDEVSESLL